MSMTTATSHGDEHAKFATPLKELLLLHDSTTAEEAGISRTKMWLLSTYFVVQSPRFVYYNMYVVLSVMAQLGHNFFFAFGLLDIVLRYQELMIVLQSVVKPIKQLLLTAALFVIVQFFFALYAFSFLRPDYEVEGFCPPEDPQCLGMCRTLFSCFFTTFDQGFKNDVSAVQAACANGLY